jgi:hypothetical protein
MRPGRYRRPQLIQRIPQPGNPNTTVTSQQAVDSGVHLGPRRLQRVRNRGSFRFFKGGNGFVDVE